MSYPKIKQIQKVNSALKIQHETNQKGGPPSLVSEKYVAGAQIMASKEAGSQVNEHTSTHLHSLSGDECDQSELSLNYSL